MLQSDAIGRWKLKQEANDDEELDVCENMEMDHAALRGPSSSRAPTEYPLSEIELKLERLYNIIKSEVF